MAGLISPVRDRLDQVLSFLELGTLYAIDRENQAALRSRAEELIAELDRMEHTHLTVGLLGGTGTGKSTVINALAGSEISSASHRRPHTDRVIVYLHELAPAPPRIPDEVPLKEIRHHSEAIRHIVMCDLPDFDSLEENHRAAVSEFVSELDIVAWITSPEKYADASFYRFMDRTPLSRDNFLFVLNKVDVLFEGVPAAEGYSRLSAVSAGLMSNLSALGIDASVYNVSALEFLNGISSPWNQFRTFRNLIFKHRDAKTIAEIKTSNIEAETSGILDALRKEANAARACLRAASTVAEELRSGSPAACAPPASIVPPGIDRELRDRMLGESSGGSALVGPGQAMELVAGWLRRAGRGEPSSSGPPVSEETVEAFRVCLSWARDRFLRAAIREDIPAALREMLAEELEAAPRAEVFKSRLQGLAAFAVEEMPLPGYRFFRLRQRLCYGSILVVLLVVLGSEPAWLRLFTAPGLVAAADVLLTFIHTLFSAQGLAALASYGLVNLFLGFRYFRRHRRIVDRRVTEMAAALTSRFKSDWQEALREAADDLEEEARWRLSTVTALSADHPPEKLE